MSRVLPERQGAHYACAADLRSFKLLRHANHQVGACFNNVPGDTRQYGQLLVHLSRLASKAAGTCRRISQVPYECNGFVWCLPAL